MKMEELEVGVPMKRLVSIGRLAPDRYVVVVELGDGSSCESSCRFELKSAGGGRSVGGMHFDSEGFNRKIMRGNIDLVAIRDEIAVLRKA
ncbi:MAG: hypothetical protein ABUL42_03830 [Terricaulis silvestris]